ncbi:uncharacterized protein UTRI_06516_B [Ustilago trichophora]|uniref:Uncharacterized protein n=1 Tax=Ustilago trichophora TaxID=86804 RepID=A0A5C3EMP6_9BASI|nr:uncharacterized protein UTRI_06516_B [Ustilago trichophora]
MRILSPLSPNLIFILVLIYFSTLISILARGQVQDPPQASQEQAQRSQTSQRTYYTDAGEHLSTPPTPPTIPLGDDSYVPSRRIYSDEDPEMARLAWFQGLSDQRAAEGKWKYIEHPLKHPSEGWGSSDVFAKTPQGEVESEVSTPSVFSAGGESEKEGDGKGVIGENQVQVEKVHDLAEGGEARRDQDLLSSPVAGGGVRRRRGRFNEGLGGGESRRGIRSHRTPSVVLSPSSSRAQFGERAHSPTRWALEVAASKLQELSPGSRARAEQQLRLQHQDLDQHLQSQALPEQQQQQQPRGASRSPPLSASSASGYASVDGNYGSTGARTPSSATFSAGDGGRRGHLSPPSPPQQSLPFDPSIKKPLPPASIAPYRVWSVEEALKSINLGEARKLTDYYPADRQHFRETLSALSSREWGSQMNKRIQWAADHRIDTSQPARVVTPLGAVLGSDVGMSGTPRFWEDPENPAPELESIVAMTKHKRIYAWIEAASIMPSALTGHSISIYEAHNVASGYKGIKKEIRDALHPIQYMGQLLRDQNGAVVFENSISPIIHKDLHQTPAESLVKLRALRAKQKSIATKQAKAKSIPKDHPNLPKSTTPQTSIHHLLGTEFTTYNRFHYPYYHTMDAFKLKNPLDTPLHYFASFSPWADAVALKPHPI